MANNHLRTAHDYGVQKALEAVGYKTADEAIKEAQALGLMEAPQAPPQKTASTSLDELFKSLGK